ncbi:MULTISPECIES: CinA family protein [Hymenobacter]|uniref:CinA family protein n=1 Tax=Hymenobacter profundi TaxID=1982110 RepID=A0ABS6WZS4_9BACT|nr:MULTISPECIES: CinA family protein [Hymenobacter]MBW3129093.1 CinA family protein [Hymenobacter profundi]QNE40268.1 CinA family protein [Hymenobacter sp. NBH84]
MKKSKEPDLETLVKLCLQHKLTLALAESCTCGLVAAQLAPVQGVSEVLLGSVVTYHAEAKQKLLGVKKSTLTTYSAESQQTTNEMAQGLHRKLPAEVCVAVTGLCGPGASESPDKPVGTVFVTILLEGRAHEYREEFPGTDGEQLRQQAATLVYEKLLELLKLYQADPSKQTALAK